MSTHEIPVVAITELNAHPNADQLELIRVFGWECAVRKGEYKVGDLIAYIPPDYVVDTTREEFKFLSDCGKPTRIRVKRLRGVISQGLIIKAPPESKEGDNVMEHFGIVRYEPPEPAERTSHSAGFTEPQQPGPSELYTPKYDVESLQRYGGVFHDREEVIATEKIHGANARYVVRRGEFFAGSRTGWKSMHKPSPWVRAVMQNPAIWDWCWAHPDHILYGEIFGNVQNLKYGAKPGQIMFRVFDIMHEGVWLTHDAIRHLIDGTGVMCAPVRYEGPYDLEKLKAIAEEDSVVAPGQLSEGLVVTPRDGRVHERYGRIKLKLVSNRYLMM